MEPGGQFDVEPARLLHSRSELGYTATLALAMHDEPEAVSEQQQIALSREARQRAELRRRHDAQSALDSMRAGLSELVRVAAGDLEAEVRALVRDFERIERRVA